MTGPQPRERPRGAFVLRLLALLVLLSPAPLLASGQPAAGLQVRPGPPGADTLTASVEVAKLRFHFAEPDRQAARDLLSRAAATRRAVAQRLGVDPNGVFHVYLAHDQAAFDRLLAGAPSWMSGVAHGRLGWAAVRLDTSAGRLWDDVHRTVRHELAHLMLRQAAGERDDLPRWFSEGFAIYVADEWSFERARRLTRALLQGRVFPLRRLERGFPVAADDVRLAYAISVAFTAFLLKQEAGRPFRALLVGLAAGTAFDDAVALSFGRSLQELEREWRGQLQWRYAWVPGLLGGTTLWGAVTVLFLMAYLRRRRARALRLAALEVEERLLFPDTDRLSSDASQ